MPQRPFSSDSECSRYLAACCGDVSASSSSSRELYDQGCYSESVADREFAHSVNLTGLSALEPDVCLQQCHLAGYQYAGLQVFSKLSTILGLPHVLYTGRPILAAFPVQFTNVCCRFIVLDHRNR